MSKPKMTWTLLKVAKGSPGKQDATTVQYASGREDANRSKIEDVLHQVTTQTGQIESLSNEIAGLKAADEQKSVENLRFDIMFSNLLEQLEAPQQIQSADREQISVQIDPHKLSAIVEKFSASDERKQRQIDSLTEQSKFLSNQIATLKAADERKSAEIAQLKDADEIKTRRIEVLLQQLESPQQTSSQIASFGDRQQISQEIDSLSSTVHALSLQVGNALTVMRRMSDQANDERKEQRVDSLIAEVGKFTHRVIPRRDYTWSSATDSTDETESTWSPRSPTVISAEVGKFTHRVIPRRDSTWSSATDPTETAESTWSPRSPTVISENEIVSKGCRDEVYSIYIR